MRSRTGGMWWGPAIEAPDPAALARFYSGLLEWPVVHEEPGTAVLATCRDGSPGTAVLAPRGCGSWFFVFKQATGYEPPVWPPQEGRQRPMMHLDLQV